MSHKAAILTQLNSPLEIWDIEHASTSFGKTCATGQVRVEMLMSGICGSQLQEIAGNKGNAGFIPHLLGHEGCGIVREVGAGVNVQLIGKKVVCHWRKGEGSDAYLTARYETGGGRTLGGGHVTTLCESAVVSRNRVTVVDDDVPMELCALLGCGLSTALGTVEQEAKLKFGESILIIGCGGVGMNLIQAAKLSCAYPIVACDVNEDKRSAAMYNQATHYINISEAFKHPVEKYDVIVDTTGNIQAIEDAIQRLASGGRFIMVGQPKPGQSYRVLSALDMFYGEGKTIIATQGGGFRPHLDIPRYVNLWRAGLLDLTGTISHKLPLEQINDGIDLVRNGLAGRVMISLR